MLVDSGLHMGKASPREAPSIYSTAMEVTAPGVYLDVFLLQLFHYPYKTPAILSST